MRKTSKWEMVDKKTFDGDIVITDPCYLPVPCAYRKWNWGKLQAWIHGVGGLESDTYYGDWGCTLYRTHGGIGSIKRGCRKIGKFCADAGLVCVVRMTDVLKINPGFPGWLKGHDWCGAVVKDFHGEVRLYKRSWNSTYTMDGKTHECIETELRVQGEGVSEGKGITFESKQTFA